WTGPHLLWVTPSLAPCSRWRPASSHPPTSRSVSSRTGLPTSAPASAEAAHRAAVAPRRRARARGAPGSPRWVGLLYVLPAMLVFGLFVLAPLVDAARLSLYAWDGVTPARYVGLQNYRGLLHDPTVKHAFEHVGVLIVLFALVPMAAGLAAAAA